MLSKLLQPVKNLYLRILLFLFALVAFMVGGLLFASGQLQGHSEGWQLSCLLLVVGAVALFKARGTEKPPEFRP